MQVSSYSWCPPCAAALPAMGPGMGARTRRGPGSLGTWPMAPFLPHSADVSSCGYAALRDEAVKLFHSLQQLEGVREPALLMQGVLQTCLDLPPLVDEIYCQLVKQTTELPVPGTPAHLRYWQMLACMSCTFRPSPPVQRYLQLHLHR